MKPADSADKIRLTPELAERLADGEEQAWQQIWADLLPTTMALVRGVLRQGPDCTEQLKVQVEALQGQEAVRADSSPHQAEAALWSAFSSFRRHFSDGEMSDARDLEQLARQFIRIAYNRWQRRHRRETRLGREAARGCEARSHGRHALSNTARDRAPGPVDLAIRAEMAEYVRGAVDEVLTEFSGRDRAIVDLYLQSQQSAADAPGQREISRSVGCSQATVSRVITKFHARMQNHLKQAE